MTEVLPGVFQFRLPMAGSRLRHVNAYLLKSDDGYVLVDCGWDQPDVLEALQSALRTLGVALDDVRSLVVTHYHSDHYGLAGTLVRMARPRLLMHRLDWSHIRENMRDVAVAHDLATAWLERNGLPRVVWDDDQLAMLHSIRRFTVVEPDAELEDGEPISVGQHVFRVIWTPGHTAGHICLHDAERRVLISGDHILDPISPNVSFSRPDLVNPMGAYVQSLRTVGALDADLVLPAHGEPFRGLSRRVGELLQHHDAREAEVLDALSRGATTAGQVAMLLPWTRRRTGFDKLEAFPQRQAVSETIAHLEELRARGLVNRSEVDGRYDYHLTRTVGDGAARSGERTTGPSEASRG
ncbi:MAG: MBL fold metallo-hydrolase [Chloroflexi bacterium]|nr:MBL fold metallo-hydrolase [Chloroflexota bacterium]